MASRKPPISGRDLIRHLPELLTGREPVIDDPAIQRFITTDPEGRAAIGLIAETAAALTLAFEPREFHETAQNKSIRDPVLASRKYARRQLADLLFYEAGRRIQASLHSRGESISLDYSWRNDPRVAESTIRGERVEELCAGLGLRANAVKRLKAELEVPRGSKERVSAQQMRSAYHLLSADVALVPGRDGSRYMQHAAADYAIARKDASEWIAIAGQLRAPEARGCALDRALVCGLEGSAWEQGIALVEELGELAPFDPAIQTHCLVMALAAGHEGEARRAGEALAFVARNDSSAWDVICGPLVWHAMMLRTAPAQRRREASRILELLPAPIQALPWRFDK